jgi:hypothetical protein
MIKEHQRLNLRAPINTKIFLRDGEELSQAKMINISQGGFFLDKRVDDLLSKNVRLDFLFLIPRLPAISKIEPRLLCYYRRHHLQHETMKGALKIVRDDVKGLGCIYLYCSDEQRSIVDQYVKTMKRNLSFVLSMFEDNGFTREQKVCAMNLLGYGEWMATYSLGQMRTHLLHDYQNMIESL